MHAAGLKVDVQAHLDRVVVTDLAGELRRKIKDLVKAENSGRIRDIGLSNLVRHNNAIIGTVSPASSRIGRVRNQPSEARVVSQTDLGPVTLSDVVAIRVKVTHDDGVGRSSVDRVVHIKQSINLYDSVVGLCVDRNNVEVESVEREFNNVRLTLENIADIGVDVCVVKAQLARSVHNSILLFAAGTSEAFRHSDSEWIGCLFVDSGEELEDGLLRLVANFQNRYQIEAGDDLNEDLDLGRVAHHRLTEDLDIERGDGQVVTSSSLLW